MAFDFLELFNAVGAAQKVITDDFIPAESLDTAISEDSMGLDSLDITLVFVILGEAYGINEELDAEWPVSSIAALQAFLLEKKTQDPEDEYETIKDLVRDLA
jgi:acyl carrier protein